MHVLDDVNYVTALDPKGIFRLTLDFPKQCRNALRIAQEASVSLGGFTPANIVLTGLGGSAAGGDFMRCLVEAFGHVPFQVNRDYSLPGYVNAQSLVICSSYSGNTEETLSAYADAKAKGAQIAAITSGGKLEEQARADGFLIIKVPGGQPPRTALGFMLITGVYLLESIGAISAQPYETTFAALDQCAKDWGMEVSSEQNVSKKLAQDLFGKIGVLYGLGGAPAVVANRWKGQINENAKNLAFANGFPELNHNEVLGWVKSKNQQGAWRVIVLKLGNESGKMEARGRVTLDLIKDNARSSELIARGDDLLTKMLTLAYQADFVSLYLAALNRVDPENIDAINILKAELAKVE
jgi:glucose/mannose-6-phosphate isomerase